MTAKMHPAKAGCICLRKFLVHGCGIRLEGVLRDIQHLDPHGALAEGDLDHIAQLDLIGGLGRLAVNRDARRVARVVFNSAALDLAGYIELFIQSHVSSRPPYP